MYSPNRKIARFAQSNWTFDSLFWRKTNHVCHQRCQTALIISLSAIKFKA